MLAVGVGGRERGCEDVGGREGDGGGSENEVEDAVGREGNTS